MKRTEDMTKEKIEKNAFYSLIGQLYRDFTLEYFGETMRDKLMDEFTLWLSEKGWLIKEEDNEED